MLLFIDQQNSARVLFILTSSAIWTNWKVNFFFQALSVKMCPLSSLKIAGFHLSAKTSSYLENRRPTEHFLRKSLFLEPYNDLIPHTLKRFWEILKSVIKCDNVGTRTGDNRVLEIGGGMKEQQRSTSFTPRNLRSEQSYWKAAVNATSIVALTCLNSVLLHEPTKLKNGKTVIFSVIQSARHERQAQFQIMFPSCYLFLWPKHDFKMPGQ